VGVFCEELNTLIISQLKLFFNSNFLGGVLIKIQIFKKELGQKKLFFIVLIDAKEK